MLITIIENNIVQDSAWHLKDYVSYFLVLIGWAFISHQNKAGFKRNELRLYINKIQEMYEATIKLTLQFYLSKDSNPALQRNEILNFLELLHTKISQVPDQKYINIDGLLNLHWNLYDSITELDAFDEHDSIQCSDDQLDKISFCFTSASAELEKIFNDYTKINFLEKIWISMLVITKLLRNKNH